MLRTGNPQLEDGYVRIANELFSAILQYPFTAAQMRVVFCIILKTYGWNKKQTPITARAVSDMTKLNLRYVKKVITKLVCDKVIIKEKNFNTNILGINKRYPQWRLWITLEGLPHKTPRSASTDTGQGPLADTQKGALQDTHKIQEIHIKDSSKNTRVNMFTSAFREYLKIPTHIKAILSKWEKG